MDVIYLGGSVTQTSTGWRPVITQWLDWQQNRFALNHQNAGVGGTGSWYALIRLQTDVLTHTPELMACDWGVNDGDAELYRYCQEAALRRILTAQSNAAVILPLFLALTEPASNNNPANAKAANQANLKTLAAHYGLTVADCATAMQDLVAAGHLLTEYFDPAETVHPNTTGHAVYAETIKPVILAALQSYPITRTLPARLYAGSADYEHDPIVRTGIDNDGETGTWATSGTQRYSSTANSTITWGDTFASFGLDVTDGAACTIAWSVDGGAETQTTITTCTPLWNGTRGAHTVTIRVVSGTVKINRFLAV